MASDEQIIPTPKSLTKENVDTDPVKPGKPDTEQADQQKSSYDLDLNSSKNTSITRYSTLDTASAKAISNGPENNITSSQALDDNLQD